MGISDMVKNCKKAVMNRDFFTVSRAICKKADTFSDILDVRVSACS